MLVNRELNIRPSGHTSPNSPNPPSLPPSRLSRITTALLTRLSSTSAPPEPWKQEAAALYQAAHEINRTANINPVLPLKQTLANTLLTSISGVTVRGRNNINATTHHNNTGGNSLSLHSVTLKEMNIFSRDVISPATYPSDHNISRYARSVSERMTSPEAMPHEIHTTLPRVNQNIKDYLILQGVIDSDAQIDDKQLVKAAIDYLIRNEKSKLALVRVIQHTLGHYGEFTEETLSDRHQERIFSHWLEYNILGNKIVKFLELNIIKDQWKKIEKKQLVLHDIEKLLQSAINDFFDKEKMYSDTIRWIWSNVILHEFPVLHPSFHSLIKSKIEELEWGITNAGLTFIQSLGEDIKKTSITDAFLYGQVLLSQAQENKSSLTLLFFRLPSRLIYAETKPAVTYQLHKESNTVIDTYAIHNFFAVHKLFVDKNDVVGAYEKAISRYMTRPQLAQQIIDDRCPGLNVDAYLNLIKGTHCRITPHRYDYSPPEYLPDIDIIFKNQNEEIGKAFMPVDKLMILSALNDLSGKEIEFINTAQMQRVTAEFYDSTNDVIPFMQANPSSQTAHTHAVKRKTDLLLAKKNQVERIYALEIKMNKYVAYRIDRNEKKYYDLLSRPLPYNEIDKYKLNIYTNSIWLKNHNDPLDHLVTTISKYHQEILQEYLYNAGYHRTLLQKAAHIGLSMIPLYNCIIDSLEGRHTDAYVACMMDVVALLPLISKMFATGLKASEIIGNGILRAKITSANSIMLRQSLRQIIKETAHNFATSTGKQLAAQGSKVLSELPLDLALTFDPGIGITGQLGYKGLRKIYSLGEKMTASIPKMTTSWSKIKPSIVKLQRQDVNLHVPIHELYYAPAKKTVPVVKLSELHPKTNPSLPEQYVKINVQTGEPFGKKYTLKNDKLVPYHHQPQVSTSQKMPKSQHGIHKLTHSDMQKFLDKHPALAEWRSTQLQVKDAQIDVTLERISICVSQKKNTLDLSNLKLTIPPPVSFDHIEFIIYSHNSLTEFPKQLPPNIIGIDVSHNNIAQISTTIPDTCTELLISNNLLHEMPAKLPPHIKKADFSGNSITTVDSALPRSIEVLRLEQNKINKISSTFGDNLRDLNLSDNELTDFTLPYPGNLYVLRLDDNKLSRLSLGTTKSLKIVSARNNLLTSIDPTLFKLPSDSIISVIDNPLSNKALEYFQKLNANIHYYGPTFYYIYQDTFSTLGVVNIDAGTSGNAKTGHDSESLSSLSVSRETPFKEEIGVIDDSQFLPERKIEHERLLSRPDISWEINIKQKLKIWQNEVTQYADEMRALVVEKISEAITKKGDYLNISDCKITSLPPIPHCIKRLIVNNNRISKIEEKLHEGLEELCLAHNSLTEIPSNLPSTLEKLRLASNNIQELPGEWSKGLKHLDVTRNKIKIISNPLPNELSSLDAPGNDMEMISTHLPESLTRISLHGNLLITLPMEIFRLPQAKVYVMRNPLSDSTMKLVIRRANALNMRPLGDDVEKMHYTHDDTSTFQNTERASNNIIDDAALAENIKFDKKFTQWANEGSVNENKIAALNELRNNIISRSEDLYLGSMDLLSIPDLPLPHVIHLHLQMNKLNKLPMILPENLIYLELTNNHLTKIPDNLPSKLKYLHMNNNELKEISHIPASLHHLFLDRNHFDTFPEDLTSNLIELSLSENSITKFPHKLSDSLKTLFLMGNKIKEVKDVLHNKLEILDLASNNLVSFPIGSFPQLKWLSVADNKLSHFPESLYESLQTLDASCNSLSEAIEIKHSTLVTLNLSNNKISTFPKLQTEKLEVLELNDNNLSIVNTHLPDGLDELIINNNQFTHIPEQFYDVKSYALISMRGNPLAQAERQKIVDLGQDFQKVGPNIVIDRSPSYAPSPPVSIDSVGHEAIKTFREKMHIWYQTDQGARARLQVNWPQVMNRVEDCLRHKSIKLDLSDLQLRILPPLNSLYIKKLKLNMNNLDRLPEDLPQSLWMLHISNNPSLEILSHLPSELRLLKANRNALIALPDIIPPQMRYMSFTHNRITSLPDRLPDVVERVLLQNNPLSQQTVLALRELRIAVSNNAELRISTSSAITHDIVQSNRPLLTVLSEWLEPTHGDELPSSWSEMARDINAHAFSLFLDKLGDAKSVKTNPYFKEQIQEWLKKLTDSPSLRQDTFEVAQEATASCHDRIICSYNDMQKVQVIHAVNNGEYDKRLIALSTHGREMYRLEQLNNIAKTKISTMEGDVDEIEVYLAYSCKLKTELQLSTVAPGMDFFRISGITEADLKLALTSVKMNENQYFEPWFVDWTPWRNTIERLGSHKNYYVEAMQLRDEFIENEYQKIVNRRLKELNLENDDDAIRVLGKAVIDEKIHSIYLGLTHKVLEDYQLPDILKPVWRVS